MDKLAAGMMPMQLHQSQSILRQVILKLAQLHFMAVINMTKPTITIFNVETGETIEREMTASEFAQYEIDQLNAAKEIEDKQNAEQAKAALLQRLGITDAEAKLLLS